MKKQFVFILAAICLSVRIYPQFSVNKVIENNNKLYLPNTLVIKLKEPAPSGTDNSVKLNSVLSKLPGRLGVLSVKKYINTNSLSSLNNIYIVHYSNDTDPQLAASKIRGNSEIEWVEPKFLYRENFNPNDPSVSSQYYLTKINAYQAWDISKGDSSIIIGIVDTGVYWDHPDLAANIWSNKNEIPGNGIDDDNNGYVDDVRGWDFGGQDGTADNNPAEDKPDHGTFVAGLASAVSDNGIGIASIGFNSTIMPVKTSENDFRDSNDEPYIVFGYEGIVYAVDNGAKIINCSWGGAGFSNLGKETIDYAASKGVLIVAAAGNSNSSDLYYPAAYNGVLAVGAVDQSDKRSFFSNFGSYVDVCAPGQGMYSTWDNNAYAGDGAGTSFSSPLTAGLAALVAQKFPLYSPQQIAEQIRTNCDYINDINPNYSKKLGRGRINAFNALNNTNSISVRGVDFKYSDDAPGGNGNGILQNGETISLGVKFINYLNPTSNLSISLESISQDVVVQNGVFNAGSAATLDSFDNFSSRFTITLGNSIPQNATLFFALNYSDGTYNDYQLIQVNVNQSFATQSGNQVSLTITSKGSLGFNDYPDNLQGTGFRYLNGDNLLFEGSLILAESPAILSNSARNNHNGDAEDNDFATVEPFVLNIPGAHADQQGSTIFNDSKAGNSKVGVNVALQSFSFSDPADQNYIIIRYHLVNTSGADINNLFAGLFTDWDLVEASGDSDITSFDSDGKFGYAYHFGGPPNTYAGTAFVSSENSGYWGILNDGSDAGSGGFSIYDGFSDAEKWQAISGSGKSDAGPGDISFAVSGGPFNIPAGDSINAAFVIAAAPDLSGLRTSIANARIKYPGIPTGVDNQVSVPLKFNLLQNYPNPFNPETKIKFTIPQNGQGGMQITTLKIYDILGKEITTLVNDYKQPGNYEVRFNGSGLASGIYFYELRSGAYNITKKMALIK